MRASRKVFAVGTLGLVAAAALAAAPQDGAKDEKKGNDQTVLTAIGGLAAQSSYFTFGYVGTVADNFEKGMYTAGKTKSLMGEVVAMLKITSGQLEGVKKSGSLNEGDAKSIDEFVVIFGEIGDYAAKLQAYVDDKTKERGDAFQEARKKTWKHIAKTLGIKTND